mmetsp:Transcript_164740/g.528535  ORF Transcript_164740/g.528535 Transcript_164740/m.528535 type:complete len:174 (-) Transcript_164740:98-619(-)|eukprot:CAMPEP_0203871286 /NCGR_PEP_ID=MMETSP0359-20131031/18663_1 /ASSEMBLY_ACC=CAM_ASM_000338 /TAXON_ID=268821 /ORGANISM="Scrippsiella Hangoei, Strain SHTV-5" /LENGTH=173 /DNA_ID=CAMNT_0050789959 /DNA_START=65 /DNA_END=586 /DNA_ORIENTATION=+
MAAPAGAHIPAGPAWKAKPLRFIEPPLVTSQDCMGHVQKLKKEYAHAVLTARSAIERTPKEALENPKRYLEHFTKEDAPPVSDEHKYTFDRVNDDTPYSQYDKRDTFHTKHTEAARKKCNVPLITRKQLRTSQNYGWLPSIDIPNNGFGRSSIFLDSAMDKSHLRVGGPWSAR